MAVPLMLVGSLVFLGSFIYAAIKIGGYVGKIFSGNIDLDKDLLGLGDLFKGQLWAMLGVVVGITTFVVGAIMYLRI